MALTIEQIQDIFTTRGAARYGREAINQLEHALQCAQLAERAGETPETVAACLLHDLGHLLVEDVNDDPQHFPEKDDLHQFIAIPFLRNVFSEAVLEPIRLHVDAKRYLCATDASYWDSLSPASKHSLELQGGVYSDEQAKAFIAQPYAAEAARLRRYDDLAKVKDCPTPSMSHYIRMLQALPN